VHDVEGVLEGVDGGKKLWEKFDEFRLNGYVAEEGAHLCPVPAAAACAC
jgi:hypothetical protein